MLDFIHVYIWIKSSLHVEYINLHNYCVLYNFTTSYFLFSYMAKDFWHLRVYLREVVYSLLILYSLFYCFSSVNNHRLTVSIITKEISDAWKLSVNHQLIFIKFKCYFLLLLISRITVCQL